MSSNVLFEFFDEDPLDNIISSLHFRFDTVIYFGYDDIMTSTRKRSTTAVLGEKCGAGEVLYYSLSQDDPENCLDTMSDIVKKSLSSGNRVFFDVTGGEPPIISMFGKLAERIDRPVHYYDVATGKLIEEPGDTTETISQVVPRQDVHLDLESYIALFGGAIDKNRWKQFKKAADESDASDRKDVEILFELAKEHYQVWNAVSDLFSKFFFPKNALVADFEKENLNNWLERPPYRFLNVDILNNIITRLYKTGIIRELDNSNDRYRISLKNDMVRSCLCEVGSVLELHIYYREMEKSDDCGVGVHVDWNGVIEGQGKDVLNEVDVITLRDNIPTFISCKSGQLQGTIVPDALYELNTVAARFGGRYAKKKLVVMRDITEIHKQRAAEMGIEVESFL